VRSLVMVDPQGRVRGGSAMRRCDLSPKKSGSRCHAATRWRPSEPLDAACSVRRRAQGPSHGACKPPCMAAWAALAARRAQPAHRMHSSGSSSLGTRMFWMSHTMITSCPRCPVGGTNSGSPSSKSAPTAGDAGGMRLQLMPWRFSSTSCCSGSPAVFLLCCPHRVPVVVLCACCGAALLASGATPGPTPVLQAN
jgi:hypothetical protein